MSIHPHPSDPKPHGFGHCHLAWKEGRKEVYTWHDPLCSNQSWLGFLLDFCPLNIHPPLFPILFLPSHGVCCYESFSWRSLCACCLWFTQFNFILSSRMDPWLILSRLLPAFWWLFIFCSDATLIRLLPSLDVGCLVLQVGRDWLNAEHVACHNGMFPSPTCLCWILLDTIPLLPLSLAHHLITMLIFWPLIGRVTCQCWLFDHVSESPVASSSWSSSRLLPLVIGSNSTSRLTVEQSIGCCLFLWCGYPVILLFDWFTCFAWTAAYVWYSRWIIHSWNMVNWQVTTLSLLCDVWHCVLLVWLGPYLRLQKIEIPLL